jgi:hypothetical protein
MKGKKKHNLKFGALAGAVVIIVVLVLGVFFAANSRKNTAQKQTDLLISEINRVSSLVTRSDTGCTNVGSGVVKLVFRHRQCVASKTDYYISADSQDSIESSFYKSTTTNGWTVMDGGHNDNNGFFGGYLDAFTNRDGQRSDLTVRLLPKDKTGQLGELSSQEKDKLGSGAANASYVVVVSVTTIFEG